MNLNNGDNYKACCSAFWVPPIKTHSWLPSCIAAWINNELMFRVDLFVTIVEIHTLILDVCVCLPEILFFVIDLIIWISLKKLKKKYAAIMNKVNLIHNLDSIWVQWFRSNSCEVMIMLKHNQHHQITFSICSSGCYNSCTAAKQNLKLII